MEYIEIVGNENMFKTAIQSVINWYNNHIGQDTFSFITKEDVCIVWFAKTLQNFKVILAKQEAYLDVYTKIDNQMIRFHGDNNE